MTKFIEGKVLMNNTLLKDKVILEIGCGVRKICRMLLIEWTWRISMFFDWSTIVSHIE